jgi:hypothetical protein
MRERRGGPEPGGHPRQQVPAEVELLDDRREDHAAEQHQHGGDQERAPAESTAGAGVERPVGGPPAEDRALQPGAAAGGQGEGDCGQPNLEEHPRKHLRRR